MDEDKTLEAVVTGTRFKFFPFTRLIFTDGTHKEIKGSGRGALRGGLGFGLPSNMKLAGMPPGTATCPRDRRCYRRVKERASDREGICRHW